MVSPCSATGLIRILGIFSADLRICFPGCLEVDLGVQGAGLGRLEVHICSIILILSLGEAAEGVEKEIQIPRMETCEDCNGSGCAPAHLL